MLSFKYDNNDRERILTSLACKFPERVFTEMDLVGFFYLSPFGTFFSFISYAHFIVEA